MARAIARVSPDRTRPAIDATSATAGSCPIGGKYHEPDLDAASRRTDTADMARRLSIPAFALAVLFGAAAPAHADITAFWGLSPTPEKRSARGFAAGLSLVVFGFEFEYANTAEDLVKGAPGLTTGMINGLVQTPTSTQFYLTAGGGLFRERLAGTGETFVGTNIGGGVKLNLAGPLRLRLDYRVFNLRGSPLYSNPQRFYAGVNLAF
jgi:hypothetical protein